MKGWRRWWRRWRARRRLAMIEVESLDDRIVLHVESGLVAFRMAGTGEVVRSMSGDRLEILGTYAILGGD